MLDINKVEILPGDVVKYLSNGGGYKYKYITNIAPKIIGYSTKSSIEACLASVPGPLISPLVSNTNMRKTVQVVWRKGQPFGPPPKVEPPKPIEPVTTNYQINRVEATCVCKTNVARSPT